MELHFPSLEVWKVYIVSVDPQEVLKNCAGLTGTAVVHLPSSGTANFAEFIEHSPFDGVPRSDCHANLSELWRVPFRNTILTTRCRSIHARNIPRRRRLCRYP